jgi:type IV pilus modification protein PilV
MNTTIKKSQLGLTLTEVLVSIMLLAIGVIAAAGLQGTALRASNKASRIQEVTKIAETELDYRRQTDYKPLTNQTCATNTDGCTVTTTPCDVIVTATSATFDCSATRADIKAFQVTVSVDGPGNDDVTLTTHVAQSQNRNALDLSANQSGSQ